MVQIAGNPFTQYTNLNILNELRVQGVLITPGAGFNIVEETSAYTVQPEDDIIIGIGTFNVTLPVITTLKQYNIIAPIGSTLTLIAQGGASLPAGSSPVTSGTAITLTSSLTLNAWLGS